MEIPSGVFTVNSYYKFLNCRGILSQWAIFIWKTFVPMKVKVFLWILVKDRLHTKENC